MIFIEKIDCLLIKPNELPKRITIDNSLKTLQQIVDGYIEVSYLLNDEEVVIICNEEGLILNMPFNRAVGSSIIAGPFLIVGDDYENGDFKSLTEKQMQKYEKVFDNESIRNTNKELIRILMEAYKEKESRNNLER